MAYSGLFHSRETGERDNRHGLFESPKENGPLLSRLMDKMKAIDLEGDDLLMLLILFLMYRESGDEDLLVVLAAMLFG